VTRVRLGRVDYLNCLPVYYPLETGQVKADVELVKGVPSRLNKLFLDGGLDITSGSSIEYARHPGEMILLPLSVSSDGRVGSIFLFSRVPVTELDGKKVCLPDTSATSVVLLKILFQHYYHVEASFETKPDNLDSMLSEADAALIIGDNAIIARQRVLAQRLPLYVADLGEVWKEFTGERMVYATWMVRRKFAEERPEETQAVCQALLEARDLGLQQTETLLDVAHRRTGIDRTVLEDYFCLIRHDFDRDYQRGLLLFYDYAYKSGLIDERVKLEIWGEQFARCGWYFG